jgi:hypothetical protein
MDETVHAVMFFPQLQADHGASVRLLHELGTDQVVEMHAAEYRLGHGASSSDIDGENALPSVDRGK